MLNDSVLCQTSHTNVMKVTREVEGHYVGMESGPPKAAVTVSETNGIIFVLIKPDL